MEIEKTRETSWRIQLKNRNENIEITSVEISGEVRILKLALLKDGKKVKVEMNKEQFYNFLSLISAFKDVVIGEDLIIDEETAVLERELPNIENKIEIKNLAYSVKNESVENNFKESDKEELNPEEWDPW